MPGSLYLAEDAPSALVALALRLSRLAPRWNPVPVLLAQAARALLGERVAIPLAVGGADEGRNHVELPFADLVRLAPEVGEAKVDVELQQVDAGGVLGHGKSVGPPSDVMIGADGRHPSGTRLGHFLGLRR